MESLTPKQQALFVSGGQLSDYEVLKPIGKGKFSVVFKATRRRDEQPVALKKIAIFDLMDARAREKTLKEVRLVQSVSHPNIVQYLDAFIENKELYIAFEWAEAGDLKRQIHKANEKSLRFEERTIWRYFSQLCAAILHLHRARIMHRDLKPANIFLTLQGVVKVGDLGLGRHLSENTLEARSKVGMPLYMSPEVLRGEPYDWKSDVWSLGCILYELAMLRSPFKSEGLNLYGLFQKINKGEYEEVPPLYSDHLRRLVARMISLTAADRPTMEEVWAWCERRPTSAALQRKPPTQPARANVEQQEGPTQTPQLSESEGQRSGQPARQPAVVEEPPTRSRPPSASPSEKQQDSGSLSRPPSSSSDSRASAKTDSSTGPTNPEENKLKSAERCMELLFDRLCLLRYEQALGKVISRKHFLGVSRFLPGDDSAGASRFDDFARVGRWLLGRLGQDLDNNESRGVSPIVTCQRMLIAAERAGVPEVVAISAPTLVDGVGGDVCDFLDAVCKRVLRVEGHYTARVSYPVEQIEVAEGDDALEVANDECAGSNDASGDSETVSSPFLDSDMFGEWLIARHEGCTTGAGDDEYDRQMIHSRIDPAMWQREMQRTIPKLRQALAEKLAARNTQTYWESRVATTRQLCRAIDAWDGPKQLATQLESQVTRRGC